MTPSPKNLHIFKKPYLAALLGLILGPLGTFYLGWKIFVTTMIIFFSSIIFIVRFFPYTTPTWFGYVDNVFFALVSYFLTLLINNKNNSPGDDPISTTAIVIMGLNSWYIRFVSFLLGTYSTVMLFSDGKWGKALLLFFIVIPLNIWLCEMIFTFLVVPYVSILELFGHFFNKIWVFLSTYMSWKRLPEWTRWILCWPTLVIFIILGGCISACIEPTLNYLLPINLSKLISPPLGALIQTSIIYFLISFFIPRGQIILMGFGVFLETLAGIFFFGALYLITNFENWKKILAYPRTVDMQPQDVLQMAACIIASWFWFFYFKRKFKQTEIHSSSVELVIP